ncbi:MAG: TRAP transporter small permease [Alphaproteobacteria bacterium]|nr:TRAP transporter small permease [Alphaproteobacteria bacterium]
MLRRTLDTLYFAGGVLGAAYMVAIAVLILVQIAGRQFGVQVRGVDDLSAWAVAGAALLPLAYTFRHGAHIRVDLIIGRLEGGPRRAMEILALALAAGMIGYFAFASVTMVWDSLVFGDIAMGLLKWPIWIPQIAQGIGAALFALALLDDLVVVATGGTPSWEQHQQGALDRAGEEL